MALQNRMAVELRELSRNPPPGLHVVPLDNSVVHLKATMAGPEGSPYEEGEFELSVSVPARYPFEPPVVHFQTPVLHPNIDSQGRICLDILNMPPKGGWKPSLNISTILISIRLLLAEPNPDDGLVVDLAYEYKHDEQAFNAKARKHTSRHAKSLARQGAAAEAETGGAAPLQQACTSSSVADQGVIPGCSDQQKNTMPAPSAAASVVINSATLPVLEQDLDKQSAPVAAPAVASGRNTEAVKDDAQPSGITHACCDELAVVDKLQASAQLLHTSVHEEGSLVPGQPSAAAPPAAHAASTAAVKRTSRLALRKAGVPAGASSLDPAAKKARV